MSADRRSCLEEMDTPVMTISPVSEGVGKREGGQVRKRESEKAGGPAPLWMRANRSVAERMVPKIQQAVAQRYSVTVAEIRGQRRIQHFAWARHVGLYLVMRLTGASSTQCARLCLDAPNPDHGTALHARRRVMDAMECYPEIRAEVEALEAKLRASIPHSAFPIK